MIVNGKTLRIEGGLVSVKNGGQARCPRCRHALDLSLQDVRKSINFCRSLHIPVLGVIENMSGLICPHCGKTIEVFKSGGGETMAREMDVPFLGRIPIDPRIVETSDQGQPFVRRYADTEAAQDFLKAIRPILHQ
jgi:ATP-binding protein involved in chromosome partitioning